MPNLGEEAVEVVCRGEWRKACPHQQRQMTYEDMHAVAEYLYGLLDDIDTVSDMVKGNDTAYRRAVERIQVKKGRVVAENDGYTIVFRSPRR